MTNQSKHQSSRSSSVSSREDGSAERLAAIRERAEKATKGAWRLHGDPFSRYPDGKRASDIYPKVSGEYAERICSGAHMVDAEFIAHAREDIPYLWDALTQAQADLDALRHERDALKVGIQKVADDLTAENEEAHRQINALEAESDALRRIADAVVYALRVGCFFPVPSPQPDAGVQAWVQWGALRHLHTVVAEAHRPAVTSGDETEHA